MVSLENTQSDFSRSRYAPKDSNSHHLFGDWAANNSNLVLEKIRLGESIEKIFGILAESRTQLATRQGNRKAKEFGANRLDLVEFYRTGIGLIKNTTEPFVAAALNRSGEMSLAKESEGKEGLWNYHTDVNGHLIPASRIYIHEYPSGKWALIQHPRGTQAKQIFEDVHLLFDN